LQNWNNERGLGKRGLKGLSRQIGLQQKIYS
jgi:hypothetical protein